MKLYYMELLPTGMHVYICEDHERHKIWVDHPSAKEISRKQYEAVKQLSNEINNNHESLKRNVHY